MSTLSRKFLTALGVEDNVAEQICERHKEVLSEIITERDELKEKAEQLDSVQKQLQELKRQAEGDSPYKEKFEKLQKEYGDYKKGVEEKETTAKKQAAFAEQPLREHLQTYLDQGLDRKEAMRCVAKDRGCSRRDIYQALLSEEEDGG